MSDENQRTMWFDQLVEVREEVNRTARVVVALAMFDQCYVKEGKPLENWEAILEEREYLLDLRARQRELERKLMIRSDHVSKKEHT